MPWEQLKGATCSRAATGTKHASAGPACRERQLLLAGLQALRQAVQRACEGRHLAQLQAHMFAGWRHLAASSGEPVWTLPGGGGPGRWLPTTFMLPCCKLQIIQRSSQTDLPRPSDQQHSLVQLGIGPMRQLGDSGTAACCEPRSAPGEQPQRRLPSSLRTSGCAGKRRRYCGGRCWGGTEQRRHSMSSGCSVEWQTCTESGGCWKPAWQLLLMVPMRLGQHAAGTEAVQVQRWRRRAPGPAAAVAVSSCSGKRGSAQ